MNQNFPDLENIVRNEFESFEPNVNPALWDKISANIATAPAASIAVAKTGAAFLTKVIVGTATTIVLGVGSYYFIAKNEAAPVTQPTAEAASVAAPDVTETTSPEQPANIEVAVKTINEQKEIDSKTATALMIHSKAEKIKQSNNSYSHSILVENPKTETASSNPHPTTPNPKTNPAQEEKLNTTVDATIEGRDYPILSITANPAGGYAPLQVELSSYVNLEDVQWDFGDNEVSYSNGVKHTFQEPGTYTVQLSGKTKDGKIITEKTVIEVKPSLSALKLPTVFTPNNDNINDTYLVEAKGLETFSMMIYNIGGQLIFDASAPEIGWDGTLKDGTLAPTGTYMCIVVGSGVDNKVYNSKQVIQLIR